MERPAFFARAFAPALVVLTFTLSVAFSIALTRQAGGVALIWMSNACLVAGLMLIKPQYRAATAGACFFANLAVYLAAGDNFAPAVVFAVVNLLESLGVVWLASQLKVGPRLNSLGKVSRLVFLAILPATALAAMAAAAYSALEGKIFLDVLLRWFAADFLGLAIILPNVLLLTAPQRAEGPLRDAAFEILVLTACATALLATPVVEVRLFAILLAFPAVTLLAFRRGPAATAAVTLLTTLVALPLVLMLPQNLVVNPAWPLPYRVFALQIFLAGWFFTGLVAALAMADQKRMRALYQRRTIVARRSRVAAQAASRAKTEFLATMSHEIRTPMNSIIGFTEVIQRKGGLPTETTRQVALIERAGASLLTIVNDILDFSKVEAGEVTLSPRRCRVAGLAQEAVATVAGAARDKGLEIKLEVEGAADKVHITDDHRLRQVLLNLLNNAVKFTETGEVRLLLTLTDDRARFVISDTGIGVPQEAVSRLFTRFSQVDGSVSRQYGGTGLGLAICKGLVDLMDGVIGVESVAGQGSTFWFEVPLLDAGDDNVAIAAEADHGALLSARVLLVDDHPINRELGATVLGMLGCECVLACDGEEAVELARLGGFDIIFMDIHMPRLDGVQAAIRIAALPGAAGAVPIVAMSADVMPEQVARFRAAGMVDSVGKPISIEAMHACLERWVAQDGAAKAAAA